MSFNNHPLDNAWELYIIRNTVKIPNLKGVHKKTFTNVNTAFNVLFRGQDGMFFIKIFVYYIYE